MTFNNPTISSPSPLPLPDVTLVMIESGIPELSRLALQDTLSCISPQEIIVLTDDIQALPSKYPAIPALTSIEDYNRILWYKIPQLVTTSHFLTIQWDGWVINQNMWSPEFLSFDYIGAVWPWHQTHRVGNGGFSLRSTELMRYVARRNYSPAIKEDDTLCRCHRSWLENTMGFSWAPEAIANQFSREHNWQYERRVDGVLSAKSFGFHDVRNWPRVLWPEALAHRIAICDSYPYIIKKREYQDMKHWLKGDQEAPNHAKVNPCRHNIL